MEHIFENWEIKKLANEIWQEFANRNLVPLRDFMTLANPSYTNELSQKCNELYLKVKNIVTRENLMQKSLDLSNNPDWLKLALFMSEKNTKLDEDTFIMHICIQLINQAVPGIDYHIERLADISLHSDLGIAVEDNMLVGLGDSKLEMKVQGIIFDNKTLIYPHQFLRRYYSGNFVGIPALLRKANQMGANVSVRIDPTRKTNADRYQELRELDHWYGPPFSDEMLKDTRTSVRTVHKSLGITDLQYDPRFTIFRSKMMDQDLREFIIEEYCPTLLRLNMQHPGVGERLCIQKFAHAIYNQKHGSFSHLDGAVRVFEISEYNNYYKKVEAGSDINEKVGQRHKMFLVEGNLSTTLFQDLLVEWFRYNPHIIEYFTGTTIPPKISYSDFDKLSANSLDGSGI